MSDALDKLKSHYAKLCNQSKHFPEIDLTVYFNPPTQMEANKIRMRAQDNESKLALYTVIFLAKDADGKPLFEDNGETVATLTEGVSGGLLTQIAQAIMAPSEPQELGN